MTQSIMVERIGDDPPLWTIGRVLAWVGATFVILFVAGIAGGFLAAQLDHGTGAHVWSGRIRLTVPVLLVTICGTAAWLALRRSWPRAAGAATPEWQRRAATRTRRTMTAWVGTIASLFMAGILIPFAAWVGTGTIAGSLTLAAGIAIGVIGLMWGTVVYMRVIDEQERQANLWCGYFGLTTYMALFLAQMIAGQVVGDLPRFDDAIFSVTGLVTLVAFLIVRFR